MKYLKMPKFSQAGDTIIEVMLSVTILAIVLATAYTTSTRSLQTGLDAQYRSEALSYANQQVELIRAADSIGATTNFKIGGRFCIDPANPIQAQVVNTSTNDCPLPFGTPPAQANYGVFNTYDSTNLKFNVTVQWNSSHGSKDQTSLLYRPYGSDIASSSCDPTICPPAPPINQLAALNLTISANPSSIVYGDKSTITWNTAGAVSCGPASWTALPVGTSGTYTTGNLTATTSYTLKCTGYNSTTQTQTATVTVQTPPNGPFISYFRANPTHVPPNTKPTLNWYSGNTKKCTISGSSTSYPTVSNGTAMPKISATKTYTLTCQGTVSGSATANVTVNVP